MRAIIFFRLSIIMLAAIGYLALPYGAAGRGSTAEVVGQIQPATSFVATGLTGDFNGDCVVNGIDLQFFARHYLTGIGSLLYRPKFDLNLDGVINVLDLQIFAAHFAEHC